MEVTFLGTVTSQGIPIIGCDCKICQSDDDRVACIFATKARTKECNKDIEIHSEVNGSVLKIDVKSALSEPLRATGQGLLSTLTKATKAKILRMLEAGIISLLINTRMISLDQTIVITTTGIHTISTYLSASIK